MRKQYQTIFGTPFGNCFATCVACIFEIDVAFMQNFMFSADDEWWDVLRAWCDERGYTPLMFPCDGPEQLDENLPHAYAILSGPGPRGLDHSVIYRGGEMVWDPHPSGDGIIGYKDVVVFLKNDPCEGSMEAFKEAITEAKDVPALLGNDPHRSRDVVGGHVPVVEAATHEVGGEALTPPPRPVYLEASPLPDFPPADRGPWVVECPHCTHRFRTGLHELCVGSPCPRCKQSLFIEDRGIGGVVAEKQTVEEWAEAQHKELAQEITSFIDEYAETTEEGLDVICSILDSSGVPFRMTRFKTSENLQRRGFKHWYQQGSCEELLERLERNGSEAGSEVQGEGDVEEEGP